MNTPEKKPGPAASLWKAGGTVGRILLLIAVMAFWLFITGAVSLLAIKFFQFVTNG